MTTQPFLRIEDLSVSYERGRTLTPALHGIGLSLAAGETLAIVGGSGSGKTTTAQAIVGLPAPAARVTSGRIEVDGHEITSLGERELARLRGRSVGLVPQDPSLSLDPVLSIGRQVAEPLIIHRLAGRREAWDRAVELLDSVGLDRPELRARQLPHQLSGGQRQRVLIAIAIATGPPLIVADEPTSGLDVTVQARVLDQLEALQREQGTAIVLITHDLGVAADRADRILVLDEGVVVEDRPAREVIADPEHPRTRELLAAAPSLSAHRPAAIVAARESGQAAAPVLSVEGLVKDFTLRGRDGGHERIRAVDDLSFAIAPGRTVAIVGESGSGKTTTARIVGGFDRPTAGTVRVGGIDLSGAGASRLRDLRRRVQTVFQSPYASLDPRFTLEQIIAEPLRSYRIGSRASRRERVAELLDAVRLPADMRDRRPTELSGGQRQRVAIARALALQPDLLILDEPVSALDVAVQRVILDLLVSLQEERGLSYLFISHDLAVVRQVAHEAIVLRRGTVQEAGPTDELFSGARSEYTRELLAAIPGRRRAAPDTPTTDPEGRTR